MQKVSSFQEDRLYSIFLLVFCTLILATNEIGTKVLKAPFTGNALPAGILTYPFVFALSDIVSETWGKKKASFMILMGFLCSLINLAIIQIALHFPHHPQWHIPHNPYNFQNAQDYQNAFLSVFSQSHMLILGSMLAYLAGQFTDIFVFDFLKKYCQGKHLWLRNNLSTFLAQFIDTIIINYVFFHLGLNMELQFLFPLSLHYYLYKIAIAILDTPFVYMGVYTLRYLKKQKPHETA